MHKIFIDIYNSSFIKYQRDATCSVYLVYFINLHVSDAVRVHHQEYFFFTNCSGISLVFYKTSIAKMHGTINIKFKNSFVAV